MAHTSPKASRARQVLDYCRHGLEELYEEPTGDAWILRWAGTLVLLRTVGDALEKVDAKDSPSLATAQAKWWQGIKAHSPTPTIFWEFIRRDRNLLVHEAVVTAGQSTIVTIIGVAAVGMAAGQEPPPITPPPPKPKATHSYHMNAGPFAGQDPRSVAKMAIQWWEKQIEMIESKAAQLSGLEH